jgi:AcrR family transcriptional regulator
VGRPRLHDTQQLLDAAVALGGQHGPAGITMAGVAKAARAPSGSLYHRFESRDALLGELWLRTVARFQAGFIEALAADPPLEACVGAARHTVGWSRRHRPEARILLRGRREFGAAGWTHELRQRIDAAQEELEAALRDAADRLPGRRGDCLERVLLVAVDIPYAVVRRHLGTPGGEIPAGAETLVEESARAILAERSHSTPCP